jgi:predicted ATP-grasp superfamily ATP-dependent carboligase/protein-tyrosine-phosphatase
MTRRVLVLGDDSYSCLTVVRSLGRQGLEVVLGAQAPATSCVPYSRYTSSVIHFPSPYSHLADWETTLEDTLRNQRFALVLPASDSVLLPVFNGRDRFGKLAKLAIADELGFRYAYFKQHTMALARELGVPIPKTVLVERREDLEHVQADRDLRLPLIIKPISSKVWKDGRGFAVNVRRVHDWQTLVQIVEEFLTITPVLIQPFVPGVSVGQGFLAQDGTVLQAFQYQCLHEPPQGGNSTYRKSTPLHQRILAHSERLLSALRWTGVAMVEYQYNLATDEFALMEINARFWAGLPLAVAAGVDFPFSLYQLLVEGRIPSASPYRVGLYCRNLGEDLRWVKQNTTADHSDPYLTTVPHRQVIGELVNGLLGKERWDTITLDDPTPGLVESWRLLRSFTRKGNAAAANGVQRLVAQVPLWQDLRYRRLRQLLRQTPNLLLVCYGDGCGSSFAEAYVRSRPQSPTPVPLHIRSAGTYEDDREVPEAAKRAGAAFGLDLSGQRARAVSPELAQWAGAIICLDGRDYRTLRRRFPELRKKIFLLKLSDIRIEELQTANSWGRSLEGFRRFYQQIAASVDGLMHLLQH